MKELPYEIDNRGYVRCKQCGCSYGYLPYGQEKLTEKKEKKILSWFCSKCNHCTDKSAEGSRYYNKKINGEWKSFYDLAHIGKQCCKCDEAPEEEQNRTKICGGCHRKIEHDEETIMFNEKYLCEICTEHYNYLKEKNPELLLAKNPFYDLRWMYARRVSNSLSRQLDILHKITRNKKIMKNPKGLILKNGRKVR